MGLVQTSPPAIEPVTVADAKAFLRIENTGAAATATSTVVSGVLTGVTLTYPGWSYESPPIVTVGGPGSGANVVASISAGVVTGFIIVSGGTGYTSPPTITMTSPDSEDQIVSDMITAARQYLENRTGRAFITQTWQMTEDGFPMLWWRTCRQQTFRTVPQILGTPLPAIPFNPLALTAAQEIRIPYPPLIAVTQIQYVDTNGVTQTLASNQYQVDNTGMLGRVAPAYGVVWPLTLIGQYNAATVTFTAG
jgi:hypothetical protein